MEWLILLLLVPAILLPIVLLCGFAGCYNPAPDPPSTAPINLAATPLSLSEILLTWKSTSPIVQGFQIYRAKESANFELIHDQLFQDQAVQTFHDTVGLEEGHTYLYQVTSYYSTSFSEPSEPAIAELFFKTAFEVALTTDQPGLEGFCLVQRISSALLTDTTFFHHGSQLLKLTVRGSTVGGLTLDNIYISQVAAAGDPYDSAADLTQVASAVSLPANTEKILPAVNYTLDQSKDLLIAFDISPTPGQGNVRSVAPLSGADHYFRAATQQAAAPDRSPDFATGTPSGRHYLIEKIEVL